MTRIVLHWGFAVWILFFLIPDLYAQLDKQGLPVTGNIVSESGPVNNAIATVFEDGREIQKTGIDESGKFNLIFSFNHEYILVLSGEDRFSKRIEISTFVPRHVLNDNPEFPPFVIEQSLFREIRGIDDRFSENTILRIFYDPGVDNFISEVFYSDSQIQEQIDNAVWRSEQVEKTAEELIKLTNAELRMMRREYTRWIQEAGENYQQGNYPEALMGYMAASRLFPKEPFPQDRIAEINDLLLALQITVDLNQVRDEKSRELISLADEAFDAGSYEQAQIMYHQAIHIKEDNSHAAIRLQETDSIIASQELKANHENLPAEAGRLTDIDGPEEANHTYEEDRRSKPDKDRIEPTNGTFRSEQPDRDGQQAVSAQEELWIEDMYIGFIGQADRAFTEEEYNIARFYYYKALEVRPEESYPQRKIRDIQKLIGARLSDRKVHEYQNYIDRADTALTQGQLAIARGYYNRALTVSPQKKYPKMQIDLIAEKLEKIQNLENRREYQSFIDQADRAFESQAYSVARYYYLRAQETNSSETYPKEQIRKISEHLTGNSEGEKPEP